MDKKYKKLVEILNENNLTRVSFEDKGKKYEVERAITCASPTSILSSHTTPTNSVVSDTQNGTEVKSPILGIFYEAPTPGKKPFVKKGDKVKKGQTLFIIEAMKVLNEVFAPTNGVIKEIKFKDGELVQFDDTVIIIG